MKYIFSYIFFLLPAFAISQAVTPFTGCPDTYVISFKDGTGCTQAPYNFFTMDIDGNITASPFFTTSDTTEINGFGINKADGFFYGNIYTRVGNSSPCTFYQSRFIRLDANGLQDTLGILKPPAGGTVSNALGTVTSDDKFIFLATVGINLFIGTINNISTLPIYNDSITPTYQIITNNCPGKNFSDWAIYSDGKLYTYGMYNNAGVSTGNLMVIDPVTGILDCIGTPNTTEFLDPIRDNFGGIFLGTDNNLYGVNVNTRKYYRFDIPSGNVTYINTITGSGQLRCDLGSCATGVTILPVKLNYFNTKNNKNCTGDFKWQTSYENGVANFIIELSADGINFEKIWSAAAQNNSSSHTYSVTLPINKNIILSRLITVNKNGNKEISGTSRIYNVCNDDDKPVSFSIVKGSNSHSATLLLPANNTSRLVILEIADMNGRKLLQQQLFIPTGVTSVAFNCNLLAKQMYIATLQVNGGISNSLKFIKPE
jgi:hypothetical protein